MLKMENPISQTHIQRQSVSPSLLILPELSINGCDFEQELIFQKSKFIFYDTYNFKQRRTKSKNQQQFDHYSRYDNNLKRPITSKTQLSNSNSKSRGFYMNKHPLTKTIQALNKSKTNSKNGTYYLRNKPKIKDEVFFQKSLAGDSTTMNMTYNNDDTESKIDRNDENQLQVPLKVNDHIVIEEEFKQEPKQQKVYFYDKSYNFLELFGTHHILYKPNFDYLLNQKQKLSIQQNKIDLPISTT